MYLINPSYEILTEIDATRILKKLELAGRVCYKSEDKISDDSAPKFCRMVLNRNHESVIEHESLTIKFIVSRSFTHELVRHRLASFSQESTRYCNYNKKGLTFIIPTWLNIEPGEYICKISPYLFGHLFKINGEDWTNVKTDLRYFIEYLHGIEHLYSQYINNKKSPQEARAILPNCLKTEIVMSANLREWKHVLTLRTDKSAHPEMRQIMIPLLEELKEKIPVIFDGINNTES